MDLKKSLAFIFMSVIILVTLVAGYIPSYAQDASTVTPVPGNLDNYVDPVTVKVHELQAQGMSNDEILQTLDKMGMGWYPPTGATWIGQQPTATELKSLPTLEYPF